MRSSCRARDQCWPVEGHSGQNGRGALVQVCCEMAHSSFLAGVEFTVLVLLPFLVLPVMLGNNPMAFEFVENHLIFEVVFCRKIK